MNDWAALEEIWGEKKEPTKDVEPENTSELEALLIQIATLTETVTTMRAEINDMKKDAAKLAPAPSSHTVTWEDENGKMKTTSLDHIPVPKMDWDKAKLDELLRTAYGDSANALSVSVKDNIYAAMDAASQAALKDAYLGMKHRDKLTITTFDAEM